MDNKLLRYEDMQFEVVRDTWAPEHYICQTTCDVAELIEDEIRRVFPQLFAKVGSNYVSLFSADNGRTTWDNVTDVNGNITDDCETHYWCDLKLRIEYPACNNGPSKQAMKLAYEVSKKVLELLKDLES